MFSEDVGFSGHGTGFEGTLGAVALGATVIEKHVTLSKKMGCLGMIRDNNNIVINHSSLVI